MNVIADRFYPDNPNRRKRAAELAEDIAGYKKEFDAIHKNYRAELLKYEAPMKRLIVILGFDTPEALHAKAQECASGETFEKWRKIQEVLDKNDRADRLLAILLSAAVVGGASLAVLNALGIVAYTMAAAAMSLLVVGFMAGVFALFVGGIFTGTIDREALKKDIDKLFKDRRDIYLCLLRMRVLSSTVDKLMDVLRQVDHSGIGAASAKNLLEAIMQYQEVTEPVEELYKEENYDKVDRFLSKKDTARGSWMNEDPNVE